MAWERYRALWHDNDSVRAIAQSPSYRVHRIRRTGATVTRVVL